MTDELWREDFPGAKNEDQLMVYRGAIAILEAKMRHNSYVSDMDVDESVNLAKSVWETTQRKVSGSR